MLKSIFCQLYLLNFLYSPAILENTTFFSIFIFFTNFAGVLFSQTQSPCHLNLSAIIVVLIFTRQRPINLKITPQSSCRPLMHRNFRPGHSKRPPRMHLESSRQVKWPRDASVAGVHPAPLASAAWAGAGPRGGSVGRASRARINFGWADVGSRLFTPERSAWARLATSGQRPASHALHLRSTAFRVRGGSAGFGVGRLLRANRAHHRARIIDERSERASAGTYYTQATHTSRIILRGRAFRID